MTQQLFDDLIGTPPGNPVDVRGIVTRERRRRRMRRFAGAACAVAALGVGTVAVLQQPGDGPPPPVISASSPASEPGFRLVAADRLTADRLRRTLDTAVRERVPTARWLATDLTGHPTADGEPPVIVPGDDGERWYYGATGVGNAGRKGHLSLQIAAFECPASASAAKCDAARAHGTAQERAAAMVSCRPPVSGCTESTGPRGERVRAQTISIRPPKLTGPWALVSHDVLVLLADGRVLSLQVGNEFATGAKSAPVQAEPPLSLDDLIAVALRISAEVRP